MSSFQEKKNSLVKPTTTTNTSHRGVDIVINSHPVYERPLNTVSDFTKSFGYLIEATEYEEVARQVGILLKCGCHEPTEADKDYIRYRIPKRYVPMRRPYRLECDVPGCYYRAIMQKYLKIHLSISDINVMENLLPVVKNRIKDMIYKKCPKINLCLSHFEENFIEDCPDCAREFRLIPKLKTGDLK